MGSVDHTSDSPQTCQQLLYKITVYCSLNDLTRTCISNTLFVDQILQWSVSSQCSETSQWLLGIVSKPASVGICELLLNVAVGLDSWGLLHLIVSLLRLFWKLHSKIRKNPRTNCCSCSNFSMLLGSKLAQAPATMKENNIHFRETDSFSPPPMRTDCSVYLNINNSRSNNGAAQLLTGYTPRWEMIRGQCLFSVPI